MRGVLLAGGSGSRLWPITLAVSKQLMPVFDKPMIYYPLSTLVGLGIQDILVITTPAEQPQFRRLLGDGSQWGLSLTYAMQQRPEGIAQALIIADDFIRDEPVALILGDNIFHGIESTERYVADLEPSTGGRIFVYRVGNPQDYGVVEFDASGRVLSIEEKPLRPKSSYIAAGFYIYDRSAVDIARALKPSARGELEITGINEEYRRRGQLHVTALGPDAAWFDTGTFSSLMKAAEFVRVTEERDGLKIGCVEEAAWSAGFIDDEQLELLAQPLTKSGYGDYLLRRLRMSRKIQAGRAPV
jgi:glucose-1-phosphate thymidylyltransferase